jgi:hypothetical protein
VIVIFDDYTQTNETATYQILDALFSRGLFLIKEQKERKHSLSHLPWKKKLKRKKM